MRILLTEDDAMIGASLCKGLRDEGYAVDWLRDASSTATALRDEQAGYDLALLDLGLPDGDGLQVLKTVRQRGSTLPVLVITARDGLQDRITGLDTGADDYIVKPFELSELKARMRSLLRRCSGRAQLELVCGDLTLNPASRQVHLRGNPIALTAREFSLLHVLMDRPGSLLSRQQLEERLYAWNETVESNAIEYFIHSLRKKLGAAAIENVRGLGWRIGNPTGP